MTASYEYLHLAARDWDPSDTIASQVIGGSRRGGGAACDCPAAGINAFSTIKRPQSEGQWACVAPGSANGPIPPPWYHFNMQEAATALVDSINGFSLPFSGAVQGGANSITDWNASGADKWFATTTETANQGAYVSRLTSPMTGWNIATQSMFAVGYSAATTVTAERILFVLAGTTTQSVYLAITATGVLRVYCGTTANAQGTTVYKAASASPFVWTMSWNRATSQLRVAARKPGNAIEVLTPASFATKPDGGKGFNVDVGGAPPVARHNMLSLWGGTDAESMAARGGAGAGGSTLITELGWTS